MKLAELFVDISTRGLSKLLGGLKSIQGALHQTTAAQNATFGGTAGATNEKDLIQRIKQAAQPFRGLQRALTLLPGEMQVGLGTALESARRATAKGLESTFKQLQKIQVDKIAGARGLGAGGKAWLSGLIDASTQIGKFQYAINRLQAGLGGMFSFATRGFFALTGGVLGFVTAGLRGTTAGTAFAYQMQQLSRQVLAVFMPVFDKVFETLQKVVGWFERLTGHQQAQIRHWVGLAAAALGVVALEGKILGFFSAIAGAMQGLISLGIELDVTTGGILFAIGAIVTGLGIWAVGTEQGRKSMKELWDTVKPLTSLISDMFSDWAETLVPIVQELMPKLVDIVKKLIPPLTKWFELMMEIQRIEYSALLSAAGKMWELFLGIADAIKDATDALEDFFNVKRGAFFWGVGGLALMEQSEQRRARRRAATGSEERREAPPLTASGPEALQASFMRVQRAAVNADYQRMAADEAKRTADAVVHIGGILDDLLTGGLLGRAIGAAAGAFAP